MRDHHDKTDDDNDLTRHHAQCLPLAKIGSGRERLAAKAKHIRHAGSSRDHIAGGNQAVTDVGNDGLFPAVPEGVQGEDSRPGRSSPDRSGRRQSGQSRPPGCGPGRKARGSSQDEDQPARNRNANFNAGLFSDAFMSRGLSFDRNTSYIAIGKIRSSRLQPVLSQDGGNLILAHNLVPASKGASLCRSAIEFDPNWDGLPAKTAIEIACPARHGGHRRPSGIYNRSGPRPAPGRTSWRGSPILPAGFKELLNGTTPITPSRSRIPSITRSVRWRLPAESFSSAWALLCEASIAPG